MRQIKDFAQQHSVHVWVISHCLPTVHQKDLLHVFSDVGLTIQRASKVILSAANQHYLTLLASCLKMRRHKSAASYSDMSPQPLKSLQNECQTPVLCKIELLRTRVCLLSDQHLLISSLEYRRCVMQELIVGVTTNDPQSARAGKASTSERKAIVASLLVLFSHAINTSQDLLILQELQSFQLTARPVSSPICDSRGKGACLLCILKGNAKRICWETFWHFMAHWHAQTEYRGKCRPTPPNIVSVLAKLC